MLKTKQTKGHFMVAAIQPVPSNLSSPIKQEIKKKSLPLIGEIALRAIQVVILTLAIIGGAALGGVLHSYVPCVGTALGAAIGGAIAFTTAMAMIDKLHAKLVERYGIEE